MPTYGGTQIIESNIEKLPDLKNRWVYHTLFWILYYMVVAFIYFNLTASRSLTFYLELFSFIVLSMGIVYLNLYLFIPKLLFRKKHLEYVVVLLAGMCAFSFINILLQKYYFAKGEMLFVATSHFTISNMVIHAFEQIYLLGLTTSIKLAKDWMRNQQLMKEKEKQYLEAELNFLKTQIQPHFFFNTLNNLYSLTLKKSDQAPEIVLKLSDLMSYMLYESNAAKVPLVKEINYLENYLEVEKLRFGKRLSVSFKVEGETSHLAIPPMILILFLENSFKHGVKNSLQEVDIEINLEVDEKFLYFKVANPVSDYGDPGSNNGIGLKNVRRKLQLLYGNDFVLEAEVWNKTYIVSLKIPVWQTA